jgi:dTDP-4-dehydrorhamnose 3,5-epimerase
MINGVEYFSLDELNDKRGNFTKLYSSNWQNASPINLEEAFLTTSIKGTTRGMHIQIGMSANFKIVSVLKGVIFDVLVDLRKNSETHRSINQFELTAGNSFIVPPGVAHGFQSFEESKILYLSDKLHQPILDLGFNVNSLPIEWPLDFSIQSDRDVSLPTMSDFIRNVSID